jgi:SAM-dependent methyltransferase
MLVGDVLDGLTLLPRDRVLHIVDRTSVAPGGPQRRARAGADVVQVGRATLGRSGDRLPFADASFDVAVAHHTLEALSDRAWALSELRRVLTTSGRLAIEVWGPIDGNPAFSVLADSLQRRVGARAEAAVHWLASLSQPDDLRALLRVAGFEHLRVTRERTIVTVPSVAHLFGWLLGTFPIGAAIATLPSEERIGIASDLAQGFGRLTDGIPFTTDVHSAAATETTAA